MIEFGGNHMLCALHILLSCSDKTCNICRTVLILTLVPLANVVEIPTIRIPGQVAWWWRILGMATSLKSVVQEPLACSHTSVVANTRSSQLRWDRYGYGRECTLLSQSIYHVYQSDITKNVKLYSIWCTHIFHTCALWFCSSHRSWCSFIVDKM